VNHVEKVLTAADVMRIAVKTVPSTMTIPELERKLSEENIGGFPVVDNGRLVGVVSRSDIIAQICTEREVAEKTSDFYFDATGFHEAPSGSSASIADRIGERMELLCVGDVMTRQPLTVSFDEVITEVARRFIDLRVHRLPVVDGDTLVGIVSTIDLVKLLADNRVLSKPSDGAR
jgi:CBS domain-containing protein